MRPYLKKTALGLLFLLALFVLYEELGQYFGRVRCKTGPNPGTIIVKLQWDTGEPARRVEVVSESWSGTAPSTYTDALGVATIEPGEDEVISLRVDGKIMMDRSSVIESWFAPRSGKDGLTFTIRLKGHPVGKIRHQPLRSEMETGACCGRSVAPGIHMPLTRRVLAWAGTPRSL